MYGLHALSSVFELYWVRTRRVKARPMELRRKKCELRKHRVKKYEWRFCEHQRLPWLLKSRFIRQREPKIARHQISKPKKMERHRGTKIEKPRPVCFDFAEL